MAVQSVKNQYRGINAHLHSFWQAEGGWGGFHTNQISDLHKTLRARLRPMGYTADLEASLQIRRIGEPASHPRADVLIFDSTPQRSFESGASLMADTIPLLELFEEHELSEKPYRAIIISPYDDATLEKGDPVVWIELLSPSNKGSSNDAKAYQEKRMNVVVGGLVFVEIDYLHETPPTFPTLANYTALHPDSHPYRILVLDPRPALEEGFARVKQFDVDESLPTINIPLNGSDVLSFDSGIPYHKTFEEAFYGDNIDYSQLPRNFDRYSPTDQLRIVRRMLTILQAAQQGIDLEQGPFPLQFTDISLEDGLKQLEAWTK